MPTSSSDQREDSYYQARPSCCLASPALLVVQQVELKWLHKASLVVMREELAAHVKKQREKEAVSGGVPGNKRKENGAIQRLWRFWWLARLRRREKRKVCEAL
ncbi:hypothetical protein Droror1_Dr00019957 [Drosera rotundifolia]